MVGAIALGVGTASGYISLRALVDFTHCLTRLMQSITFPLLPLFLSISLQHGPLSCLTTIFCSSFSLPDFTSVSSVCQTPQYLSSCMVSLACTLLVSWFGLSSSPLQQYALLVPQQYALLVPQLVLCWCHGSAYLRRHSSNMPYQCHSCLRHCQELNISVKGKTKGSPDWFF